MEQILGQLFKLADTLDKKQLTAEADMLDLCLKKLADFYTDLNDDYGLTVYDWSGKTAYKGIFHTYEAALKEGYKLLKNELKKTKPDNPNGPAFHIINDKKPLPNGKKLFIGRPSDLEKPDYSDKDVKSVN